MSRDRTDQSCSPVAWLGYVIKHSWTDIRQFKRFMITLFDVNELLLTVYATEDSIIERSWAGWDRDCFITVTREQQTTHSAHARVLHCCALSYICLFNLGSMAHSTGRIYKQTGNREKAKKNIRPTTVRCLFVKKEDVAINDSYKKFLLVIRAFTSK